MLCHKLAGIPWMKPCAKMPHAVRLQRSMGLLHRCGNGYPVTDAPLLWSRDGEVFRDGGIPWRGQMRPSSAVVF